MMSGCQFCEAAGNVCPEFVPNPFRKQVCFNCFHAHGKNVESPSASKRPLSGGFLVSDVLLGSGPLCPGCGLPVPANSHHIALRDKQYHVGCFACGLCREPFAVGADGQISYRERSDGVLVCESCLQSSRSRATSLAEKPAPPSGPPCARCGLATGPDVLRLTDAAGQLERLYHPDCFGCTVCNRLLAPGAKFSLQPKGVFCEPCHEEALEALAKANGPRCAGCRQPVGSENALALGDRKWHLRCFCCGHCGNTLQVGADGVVNCRQRPDGSVLCQSCYYENILPKCAECGKPMPAEILTVEGRVMHPECFRCDICLNRCDTEQSYQIDGHPVCQGCVAAERHLQPIPERPLPWDRRQAAAAQAALATLDSTDDATPPQALPPAPPLAGGGSSRQQLESLIDDLVGLSFPPAGSDVSPEDYERLAAGLAERSNAVLQVPGVDIEAVEEDVPRLSAEILGPEFESDDAPRKRDSPAYRTHVAYEILGTERAYVKQLTTCLEYYREPLRTMKLALNRNFEEIYSNFDEVIAINRVLLANLDQRMANWDTRTTQIGDVIMQLGPYLKPHYTKYMQLYRNAQQVLKECEKNPAFCTFLDETQDRMEGNLTLRGFLVMPIQRIPRYILLLEDLLKHTPTDHPDHGGLFNALAKLRTIANDINEAIRESENRQRMFELKNAFVNSNGLTFVAPHRLFVKDGPLRKVCRKSTKPRWLFLFNDMLVYASLIQSALINFRSARPMYYNPKSLDLLYMRLEDTPDTDAYKNAFQIVSRSKSFVVFAPSFEEKAAWMLALTDTIAALKNRVQKHKASTGLHASAGAGQEPVAAAGVADNNAAASGGAIGPPSGGGSIIGGAAGGVAGIAGGGGDGDVNRSIVEAPIWVPDRQVVQCGLCTDAFTLLKRRHHCRACGACICGNCSTQRLAFKELGRVRVCDKCFALYKDRDRTDRVLSDSR